GLNDLGGTLASGGVPLLLVTTENLLGVEIDRYIELSDKDAQVVFDAMGGLSVDIPSEVTVPAGRDQARLLFAAGRQQLSGRFLVDLLYTIGLEEGDVDLGVRHLAFWDAIFDQFGDTPSALGNAIRAADAALGESDAEVEEHAVFVEALALLSNHDRDVAMLPVSQVSVGGSELYEVNPVEIAQFVSDKVGAAVTPSEEVRVQVLNGNGVPGIGVKVAKRLVGEGFRVILGGNATQLDYEETLIVTYDSSTQGLRLAGRARDLLGVGEVQVSAQQQGIVDLTIVVGKDFLRTL
ncbi:MAG: LCP family protein, partial [Actinomycetota bacterium]